MPVKYKTKIPTFIHNAQLLISMARRRGIKLGSTSQANSSSSVATINTSKATKGKYSKERSNQSQAAHSKKVDIPLEDPDKPSTDLRRKPRGIIRWLKHLPGRIKRFWYIQFPLLTPEELEGRELLKQENLRNKLGGKEAKKYGKLASDHLAVVGNREIIGGVTPDKPKRIKKLKWDCWARDELFTKLILSMRTAPKYLPAYVRISDLARDPLYSQDLLSSLHHYVKWDADDAGVRLTIFRHGLDGLPEFVAAEEIWRKIPNNKPPLTFTVGYGDNSKRFDVDLDDCPHLIVGGATKQGKSNFINQMISFWLWRGLTPQDLQLVLFDLKRGMEFTFYEGLPHLYKDTVDNSVVQKYYEKPAYIETGIIEELKEVVPALLRLRQIMNDRMLYIKKAGHKDVNSFNRAQYSKQKRIPSLVVIFDEWARISLTLGKEPESLLAEVAGMARAAGMYFIIGTQNPNGAVISNLISINFQARIIFKCSTGGSQAALGNWAAAGLEERGRCILAEGGEQWKIQTPRISDGLIQSVVYKAITGKDKKFGDAVDLEEILQESLNNLDGILSTDKLFAMFKPKKVRYRWLLTALKEAEGREYILSGSAYTVSHKGKNKPRRLIPVDKLIAKDK